MMGPFKPGGEGAARPRPGRPREEFTPTPTHPQRTRCYLGTPTPRARRHPRPSNRIQQSHLLLCKAPRSCRFRYRSGPPASRFPATEAVVGGELHGATSRCTVSCSEAPGCWSGQAFCRQLP
ncbi:hypothetical protein MAPG_10396 [Magnaporthiopsis poae ATCC 64411]|uniref:Uncharacterized protein n=1 Tax=Magnaporthiopsis poae (strain ATCC 64411 / 73-15) TaxID=644358 RepID=A0A0C4ECH2_MAGP6|nr:hypothetical protein MAPG_10396 [Magnaporthiopsis poae ATCC 64411]